MSILARFQAIENKDKDRAVATLVKSSTPDFDFFFLIILSVVMATLGLLAGNETVVIGSMLIAPLLSPVLAMGLGIAMSGHNLITRSGGTIAKASAVAVVTSVATAIVFSYSPLYSGLNDVILSRTEPSLLFFMIAIASGLAVAYALVEPEISEMLPGVAVSVALMPPLAVVGIGIAQFDVAVASGALIMYLVNVAGIIGAAMVTFSLMDVHYKKQLADNTIKQEEEKVDREEQKVKQIVEENTPPTVEEIQQ